MKKFSGIQIAILTLSLIAAAWSAVPVFALMGDVDGDGAVDGFDAVLILRHDVGLATLSAEQLINADTDASGEVDGYDAVLVLRCDVGLTDCGFSSAAVTLSNPTGATTSSLNLSWTQSGAGDFASYKVYRSTSSGVSQSSTLVTTITSKTTTSATASSLSVSTKYYFKVYVCDTGSLCTGSNEVNGTTSTPSDTFQSISVTPTSVSIQNGNTSNLTATCTWTIAGQAACPTLTWTSTNTSSATVSSQGVVTGVNAGSATVKASASGVNSNNVAVTVTDSGGDPDNNEWITIPAGDFVMGCDIGGGDPNCDYFGYGETPKHTVTLSGYKIQKYEVTNTQYKACVDAAVCSAPSSSNSYTRTPYYGNATYDNYPVIYVNWTQASAYCAWIGGRLPTEAEWEKAARGPIPREVIYPWGNDTLTCSLANYSGCLGDTKEVGSHPAGASYYGLMDMAGNVWEWVNDWYSSSYYSSSPSTDPTGPTSGGYRVLRGGSWYGNTWLLRVSGRSGSLPSNVIDYYGFRCAQD